MKFIVFIGLSTLLFQFAPDNTGIINLPIQSSLADTSKAAEKIITTKRYQIKSKGVSFKRIEPYFDSTYYPKSLYFNIRIAELTGLTIKQVNDGKFTVKVLNQQNEEVTYPKETKQYVAITSKEGEQINILASIPLNPVDKYNNQYIIKYFWKHATSNVYIDISCRISNK